MSVNEVPSTPESENSPESFNEPFRSTSLVCGISLGSNDVQLLNRFRAVYL